GEVQDNAVLIAVAQGHAEGFLTGGLALQQLL
ncbi:hypothetical protein SAMN05444064_1431, partial [Pseudomonas syringae]